MRGAWNYWIEWTHKLLPNGGLSAILSVIKRNLRCGIFLKNVYCQAHIKGTPASARISISRGTPPDRLHLQLSAIQKDKTVSDSRVLMFFYDADHVQNLFDYIE